MTDKKTSHVSELWKLKTAEERHAIAMKSVATRRANIKKEADEAEKIRQEAMLKKHGLLEEIYELEKELGLLKQVKLMNVTAATLADGYLLTEKQIVDDALPVHKLSGVYFLVQNNRVVYVGQSTNVYARIAYHGEKRFDACAYIPCHPSALDKLESIYIHLLRPPLNATHPGGGKHAPVPLARLLGDPKASDFESPILTEKESDDQE